MGEEEVEVEVVEEGKEEEVVVKSVEDMLVLEVEEAFVVVVDVLCVVALEVEGRVTVVLMVLVVVLHVGVIYLAVQDEDPEMVKVEVWPALDVLDVQLHDVTVDSRLDVATAGAGLASASLERLAASIIWRKERMVE